MSVESVRAATRILTGAAVVIGLHLGTCAATALAAPTSAAAVVTAAVPAPVPDWKDDLIKRAFRDVLDRQPSSSELREYRNRIDRDRWTEDDIRSDLRSRYSDRDRQNESSRDRQVYSSQEADRIIRNAYRDILKRDPDPEGLRNYRHEMLDKGMTEAELRRSLRQSAEKDSLRADRADAVIRRAYQDILGRDPDPQGLANFRNKMVNDHWTERQVRDSLMNSAEYREKNTMTREKAQDIVKRAYREVLGRDADTQGLEVWTQKVLREKLTQADVNRALRESDEYKNKRR